MSFSLKTLLGTVAFLAVSLIAYQKLHDAYYLRKLNHYVEVRDTCLIIELLRYGQDQGFRKSWADEILANSARSGDFHILRYFRHTTDYDRKLGADQTPLMIAAANGHFNTAKFLLVQNVSTRLRDKDGDTALDLAKDLQHPEIASLISASEHESWNGVLKMECVIHALSCDANCNREPIETLLQTDGYSALSDLRVELPSGEKQVGLWFQVSNRICIGIYFGKESGCDSINFCWAIDGMRVDDVEYFYPPSFLQ